jgi:sterol desaturase/sphingolipid hydroxylase (fatty acid hydroxylase superfamily)
MKQFYLNFPAIAFHSWPAAAGALAIVSAVFVLSRVLGHRAPVSQPRAVVHDAIYYGFYNSILAIAILQVPLHRLLLPFLRLIDWHLLTGYPEVVRFVVFLMAADFMDYWNHRLMHTRWFWPLHSMHHAQRDLTAFSATRKHVGEAVWSMASLLALTAIIGDSPQDAMWFFVFRYAVAAANHSGLRWRFGPLYWILVSPLFHSAHHSIEVEVSEHNYGNFFSVWDQLFGTHIDTHLAPARQGVEGLSMPTLRSQFWMPLQTIGRNIRGVSQLDRGQQTPAAPVQSS